MRSAMFTCAFFIGITAAPATAQINPVEIGVDGGFNLRLFETRENITNLTVPFQRLRIAAGLTDQLSLDTALGIQYISQDETSTTGFFVAPGLAFHFQPFDREATRPYVGAFGIIEHVDGSNEFGSGGDTQFGFGGGLGVKLPVSRAGFFRLEGMFSHLFESDLFVSENQLTIAVGLGAVLN